MYVIIRISTIKSNNTWCEGFESYVSAQSSLFYSMLRHPDVQVLLGRNKIKLNLHRNLHIIRYEKDNKSTRLLNVYINRFLIQKWIKSTAVILKLWTFWETSIIKLEKTLLLDEANLITNYSQNLRKKIDRGKNGKLEFLGGFIYSLWKSRCPESNESSFPPQVHGLFPYQR